MSGIAGWLNCIGEPVEEQRVREMIETISHRGPDGQGYWSQGPVGLAHCLLHTTPESLHEVQPLASQDGSRVIVCDARVDNRSELATMLEKRGATPRTDTDPELILIAYECFGAACPQHLVGDFAFAIWDRREHRLFCARDPVGVKPLYYCWDGRRFAFASEIKALLRGAGVPKRMNDWMIADHLLMDYRYPDATFFDGVMQLRPGHALSVDGGGIRLLRHWNPSPEIEQPSRRPEEYLDEFREVFREAVRCRLRSHYPVGVMLSGGIDSTLVTATAEILRREQPARPHLATFTLISDAMSQAARNAIDRLARCYGTEIYLFPVETGVPLGHRASEAPGDAFLTHPPLVEAVAAKGCRVLLTGYGADELLRSSEDGILRDLLREWRLVSLLREVWRLPGGGFPLAASTVTQLLWESLPPWMRWIVKAGLGRRVPFWIEPGLAQRLGLARRKPAAGPIRFPTMCQEESFRTLTAPSTTLDLAVLESPAVYSGMEWRHPFLDRRLIEFFLSVPPAVKAWAGPQKRFAQLAFQDVAPWAAYDPEPVPPPDRDARHAEFHRIRETLGPATGPLFRYVNCGAMDRVMREYVCGNFSLRTQLWKTRELQRWMEEHFPEEIKQGGNA